MLLSIMSLTNYLIHIYLKHELSADYMNVVVHINYCHLNMFGTLLCFFSHKSVVKLFCRFFLMIKVGFLRGKRYCATLQCWLETRDL